MPDHPQSQVHDKNDVEEKMSKPILTWMLRFVHNSGSSIVGFATCSRVLEVTMRYWKVQPCSAQD